MAEQLLELPFSLLEAGSVAAESLVGIGVYGCGLLMSVIRWIFASSFQVAEMFPTIFETGERIVFAFVSVVTSLLEASFTVVQVLWNAFTTGVDIAWSGLMLIPDFAWTVWNILATGSSIAWKALVIGGSATLKSISLISIVFWNSLKFVVIGSWSVLTTSLQILLSVFNILAYVTYEVGFFLARGLRAAFVLSSALFHFGSNKLSGLFHLQSWTAVVQYVYRYFHAVYTSFKLNVKFIADLPSLVLQDNLMLWTSIVVILLSTAVLYMYVKMKNRKRTENQNPAAENRNPAAELHRNPVQRPVNTIIQPPPDVLTHEINQRRNSGQSAGSSESADANNELQQRLRELELRLDREKEQQMCVVCLDSERLWMLKPCNHYCVCEQCVHHLNNKCPICRKVIRDKEKVFHV